MEEKIDFQNTQLQALYDTGEYEAVKVDKYFLVHKMTRNNIWGTTDGRNKITDGYIVMTGENGNVILKHRGDLYVNNVFTKVLEGVREVLELTAQEAAVVMNYIIKNEITKVTESLLTALKRLLSKA